MGQAWSAQEGRLTRRSTRTAASLSDIGRLFRFRASVAFMAAVGELFVIMDRSYDRRVKFMAELTKAIQRAALRTKGAVVPLIVTPASIKRIVKKQLVSDLRYCQSEGVDVADFIKAKYKL